VKQEHARFDPAAPYFIDRKADQFGTTTVVVVGGGSATTIAALDGAVDGRSTTVRSERTLQAVARPQRATATRTMYFIVLSLVGLS